MLFGHTRRYEIKKNKQIKNERRLQRRRYGRCLNATKSKNNKFCSENKKKRNWKHKKTKKKKPGRRARTTTELRGVYVTAANRLAAVGGGRWRFGGGGRTGSPTCVPTLTECWGIGWG